MDARVVGSTLQLPFRGTDAQWSFLNAEKRFALGSGGYASGKSTVLRYSLVQHAILNPNAMGMLIADTYGRLARDVLPKFKMLLDTCGIRHRKIKPVLDGIRVPGWLIGPGWINHTLLFGSVQNPNSLKGPDLSHIHVEEATTIRDTVPGLDEPVFNVMMSRLRVLGGTNVLRASGTPESLRNWTMRPGMFWRPPVDRTRHDAWRRDFQVVLMSSWDTQRAGLLPPGFVDSMASAMTPQQVSEKIDGIPKAGAAGQAYDEFLYERNVRRIEFDPFLGDVIAGLDFNVNPMTATLSQWNRGVLQIFAEIVLPHSTTRAMAREIVRRCEALKINPKRVRVFPDASGRARRTTGESDFDVLREEGLTRLTYPKEGNPYVSERLNAVNASLYHSTLLVDERCVETIADFEQVAKDDQGDLIKTDAARTHLTDGVGYVVTRLQPLRGRRGGILLAA